MSVLALGDRINALTKAIIGAAIRVHRALGPGLLESAYRQCLAFELARAGLHFEMERPLPIVYEGVRLDCAYRVDFLVEGQVIIEVKSIESVDRIHVAQMLTYLKASGCPAGLLMNFNVTRLVDGIRRAVLDDGGKV